MEYRDVGLEVLGADGNEEATGVMISDNNVGAEHADRAGGGNGEATGDQELASEMSGAFCGGRNYPKVLSGLNGGDAGARVEASFHDAYEGGAFVVGLLLKDALAAGEVEGGLLAAIFFGVEEGKGVHGYGGDG